MNAQAAALDEADNTDASVYFVRMHTGEVQWTNFDTEDPKELVASHVDVWAAVDKPGVQVEVVGSGCMSASRARALAQIIACAADVAEGK